MIERVFASVSSAGDGFKMLHRTSKWSHTLYFLHRALTLRLRTCFLLYPVRPGITGNLNTSSGEQIMHIFQVLRDQRYSGINAMLPRSEQDQSITDTSELRSSYRWHNNHSCGSLLDDPFVAKKESEMFAPFCVRWLHHVLFSHPQKNLLLMRRWKMMAFRKPYWSPVTTITLLVLTCAFDIRRCSGVCISCLACAFDRVCWWRMWTNCIRIATTIICCATIYKSLPTNAVKPKRSVKVIASGQITCAIDVWWRARVSVTSLASADNCIWRWIMGTLSITITSTIVHRTTICVSIRVLP